MQSSNVEMAGKYQVTCRMPNGQIRWQSPAKNLIVNAGLAYMSTVSLANATKVYPWYLGVTAGTPAPAAGDTMASHTGWTEVSAYTQESRPAYVATASGLAVANVTAATFTISSQATTVGGVFLSSSATKGSTSGTLFSVAALSGGNQVANIGDAISVTYTMTPSAT